MDIYEKFITNIGPWEERKREQGESVRGLTDLEQYRNKQLYAETKEENTITQITHIFNVVH